MRIFKSIALVASVALASFSMLGCTEKTAGIEIGNPSIGDGDTSTTHPPLPEVPKLVLTADFSIDYSDLETRALAKSATKNEPVLLDSFAMDLFEVRTYSSYYYYMPGYDLVKGMRVWPTKWEVGEEEEDLDTLASLMNISFTKGTFVEDAFENISLMDGGFLKEIGVAFKNVNVDDIRGRVLIGDEYVHFVYDMSEFQNVMLRYHYSQIEIDSANSKANLPVVFLAKRFTSGIDFSNATISEDGVIYIDQKNNVDLWNKLNKNFVPSFGPLRYFKNEDSVSYFIDEVWKDLAPGVKENALINGNFKSPFSTDWILVTQYGGRADSSVIEEKGGSRIMEVNVSAGGDSSFSVQLLQENIALVEGATYQCVFTIWSDVEDSITVRIGAYDTYKTIGFSEHVNVGKLGSGKESHAITFEAKTSSPFGRFEMNLGKRKRWFRIKDLQVIRLTK